jgi:hypothetical protein
MRCVGIVETGLVSGSAYHVGGSARCRTNDDIDFVPYREQNVLRLERTSKAVLDTHTFLWGKVFDAKRRGRKNNNCGLKGLANFEIAKLLISICTVHIKFYFG